MYNKESKYLPLLGLIVCVVFVVGLFVWLVAETKRAAKREEAVRADNYAKRARLENETKDGKLVIAACFYDLEVVEKECYVFHNGKSDKINGDKVLRLYDDSFHKSKTTIRVILDHTQRRRGTGRMLYGSSPHFSTDNDLSFER